MSTRPPSTQRDDGSHSGFDCLLSPLSAPQAPSRGVQLDGGDILSHVIHSHGQPKSSPLGIEHSFTIVSDLGALVKLAGRLQPFLPPSFRWLGQEDVKVIGTRPIDAGGFADIWVGEVDNRKVAVKSYRCYASADYVPTYKVCRIYPLCV